MQKGRKPQKALETPVMLKVNVPDRPKPPENLTEDQAAVWTTTVNAMAPDWFKAESWALLEQYCRHVVAAKHVSFLIDQADPEDLPDYDRLLKMQEREGRAMGALATRMRITQQSTASKGKNKHAAQAKKPWE